MRTILIALLGVFFWSCSPALGQEYSRLWGADGSAFDPRAQGWHDHRRGVNIRKGLSFAGGAAVAGLTSAYAILHYTEHEEQFLAEIEPLIESFRNEQDDAFRAVIGAEIIDKMGSYLGRFMVDDTVVDVLKLATIYKILGEE